MWLLCAWPKTGLQHMPVSNEHIQDVLDIGVYPWRRNRSVNGAGVFFTTKSWGADYLIPIPEVQICVKVTPFDTNRFHLKLYMTRDSNSLDEKIEGGVNVQGKLHFHFMPAKSQLRKSKWWHYIEQYKNCTNHVYFFIDSATSSWWNCSKTQITTTGNVGAVR